MKAKITKTNHTLMILKLMKMSLQNELQTPIVQKTIRQHDGGDVSSLSPFKGLGKAACYAAGWSLQTERET